MRFTCVVLAAATGLAGLAEACSMVSYSDSNTVLVGNNEDYAKDGHIWFVPGRKNRFARVNVGIEDDFAQGSINEKGLCFDAAVVLEIPLENAEEKNVIEDVMNTCATVEEVIAALESVRFKHFARSQFFFADATGASAVITWHPENRLSVVRKDGPWQVVTNCRMEDTDFREDRYVLAERILEKADGPTKPAIQAVLEAIYGRAQEPTGYATIYDLKTLEVTLFNRFDFTQSKTFNLREEMAGSRWSKDMDNLFENPVYESLDGPRRYNASIEMSQEALGKFAGHYKGPEGNVSEVRVIEGGLVLANSAGQVTHLYPESDTTFRMREAPALIQFETDADGKAIAILAQPMEQRTRRAVRVE